MTVDQELAKWRLKEAALKKKLPTQDEWNDRRKTQWCIKAQNVWLEVRRRIKTLEAMQQKPINAWTVWIDGKAYGGESEETEESVPTVTDGWGANTITRTRNKIKIGGPEPKVLRGKRMLRSHMERILDRIGELPCAKIEILRHNKEITD